ncbi:MAG: hypothetical protein ACK55I_23445, partial [bacterium]
MRLQRTPAYRPRESQGQVLEITCSRAQLSGLNVSAVAVEPRSHGGFNCVIGPAAELHDCALRPGDVILHFDGGRMTFPTMQDVCQARSRMFAAIAVPRQAGVQ